MAIFHSTTRIIRRSSGRSSVAAAAYRAGDYLKNERDGIIHDYTKKSGVEYSEIMLPKNSPEEYLDRETLWNAVEKVEKRKDAQTAREIEIALPSEFDRQEQIAILREYIQDNFISKGMCADFSLHDRGDGNPHSHIMLTTRTITPEGFGNKERSWNDWSNVEHWREQWAVVCNRELNNKGIAERMDHRSYAEQGIDREPTIHIGPAATQMERRGQRTERGRYNEEVRERNIAYRKEIDELTRLDREIKEQQGREAVDPRRSATKSVVETTKKMSIHDKLAAAKGAADRSNAAQRGTSIKKKKNLQEL